MLEQFADLNLNVEPLEDCFMANIRIEPSLIDRIKEAQRVDARCCDIANQLE